MPRVSASMPRSQGCPPRRRRGFTLIEVLVVVVIVGVLASVALPFAELQVRRSKEADLRTALRTIRQAIDAYKDASDAGLIARPQESSGYPPTLSALVDGVAAQEGGAQAAAAASQAPSAMPPVGANVNRPQRRLYFLRSLPRDPFAPRDVPADQTWALRSYDSPPNDAHEGADVFDVHSRSELHAIDGTVYQDW
jgi:general secretion pathway protein G